MKISSVRTFHLYEALKSSQALVDSLEHSVVQLNACHAKAWAAEFEIAFRHAREALEKLRWIQNSLPPTPSAEAQ